MQNQDYLPSEEDRSRALKSIWQQDQSLRRATGQQCQTFEDWAEERARRALSFKMMPFTQQ